MVLGMLEKKLDELMINARMLSDSEEDCAELELAQDKLLDELIELNNALDESEKYRLLQKSPRSYSDLEMKITHLSRLNQRRLKSIDDRFVRKARVHRRKMKNS